MTPQGRLQNRGTAPGQARALHSARGRWIVTALIVASGAVFLEGTTVNVALPAIARDFGLGVEGLQWVLNGYLLTLTALMLLGGALGDRFRRPAVFAVGCVAFAVTFRWLRGRSGHCLPRPASSRPGRRRSAGSAEQPRDARIRLPGR